MLYYKDTGEGVKKDMDLKFDLKEDMQYYIGRERKLMDCVRARVRVCFFKQAGNKAKRKKEIFVLRSLLGTLPTVILLE